MAQAIGQVSLISGSVIAAGVPQADGFCQERVLELNAPVYPGETIITEGETARVELALHDSQLLSLGKNDKLFLNDKYCLILNS